MSRRRTQTRRLRFVRGLFLVGALAIVAAVIMLRNQGEDLTLARVYDGSPTTFSFRYPQAWVISIPFQGTLVSGSAATLNENRPGPTFTVQRNAPVSTYGSLEEAFDQYLRRGPLQSGRSWSLLRDVAPTTFLGRAALNAEIQGRENAASPEQRATLIATTSANGFVYIFVLTAPVETWDTYAPTLNAMLASVQVFE